MALSLNLTRAGDSGGSRGSYSPRPLMRSTPPPPSTGNPDLSLSQKLENSASNTISSLESLAARVLYGQSIMPSQLGVCISVYGPHYEGFKLEELKIVDINASNVKKIGVFVPERVDEVIKFISNNNGWVIRGKINVLEDILKEIDDSESRKEIDDSESRKKLESKLVEFACKSYRELNLNPCAKINLLNRLSVKDPQLQERIALHLDICRSNERWDSEDYERRQGKLDISRHFHERQEIYRMEAFNRELDRRRALEAQAQPKLDDISSDIEEVD